MRQSIWIIFISSTIFLSCNRNKERNISVKGIVLNSESDAGISNAQVTLLGWSIISSGEETYDKIDLFTDSRGHFEASFDKVFKVSVGSIATGYFPSIANVKADSTVILRLKPKKRNENFTQIGNLALFIRKNQSAQKNRPEVFGLDILNQKSTNEPGNMDLAPEIGNSGKYPNVLVAVGKGGIVPIFNSFESATLIPPKKNFLKRYVLTGREKGFFIRCRDGNTYARLSVFSLQYNKIFKLNEDIVSDFGVDFNITMLDEDEKTAPVDSFRLDYYIITNG